MTTRLHFDRSIVRIYSQAKQVKGAGFLVSENQILTCAHVVALALGIPKNSVEIPTAEVNIDFPIIAPKEFLTAKVIFWLPVNPEAALEDIAVLELTNVPNNAFPVRLMTSQEYWEHRFRVLGFPLNRENGAWANGVLRGSTANGWVQLEDTDQNGYALEQGFSGAPVLDENLDGVVGMAVATDINRPDARVAFIIPTNILMQAWPQLQERAIATCPYKGLFAFQEADAEYFFGREAFTEKLVAAVAAQQFVAVIGPSGSGKSSVVFAGLIPQLRSQGNWQIEQFRPKAHPFDELARALVRFKQPEKEETGQDIEALQLSMLLESKESTLSTWLSSILEKHPGSRLLLMADQFEEIYTLCTDQEKRVLFLERLLNAVANIPDLILVLTLRADFLGYALSDRLLADALQNADVKLGPMNGQELREVIEKPAQKLGVRLEAGLTERILKDVERSPGNLPLLEFALELLWAKQSNGQLTHEGYEEVGGVEKALASYADDVYDKLSEGDREKAERVFIQLVQPGMGTEDTRKVATSAEVGADNWDLVRRLADARLVVTGRDETGEERVEVIHEALIREWGMLRGWMAVSREFRVWQEKLKGRLVEWEDKDKDDGALLRGLLLVEAEKWQEERLLELSQEERVFIQLSLALRDREVEEKEREQKEKVRLQRRAIQWLSGGLATALIAVGVAGWQWRRADIGEKNAQMRADIANLRARFASTQSMDIMLEGIQIVKELKNDWVKLDTQIKGIDMLREMVYWQGFKEHNTLHHDSAVNSMAFSSKGDLIATASDDQTAKLWKPDGTLVANLEGHSGKVLSIAFNLKGDLIATASDDQTAKLWKPDGTLVANLEGHDGKVLSVAFSPKRNLIATGSSDGTVKLWKTDGTLIQTLPGHSGLRVIFSPNGELLAALGSNGKTVKLWKPDGTPVKTLIEHNKEVNSIVFSPKGDLIATASTDNTVKLWTSDGTPVKTLTEHNREVNSIAFSPKGDLIATASTDNTVKLWTSDGTLVETLKGHSDKFLVVIFDPKGELIASASEDNTVKIWKPDGTLMYTLSGHKSRVNNIAFSPNGDLIASSSSDTVKLWKVNNTFTDTFEGHCRRIAFSPKDDLIALGCYDGTLRLWKADGQEKDRLKYGGIVTSVAFSPDGKLIATASDDGVIKLLKPNGNLVRILEDGRNLVKSNFYNVAFSVNGDLVAAGLGKNVRLWKTDGTPVYTLTEHSFDVTSVAFSPNGKLIATASGDTKVKLWKLDSIASIGTIEEHEHWIFHIAFSPNGKLIATASGDTTVKLWKLNTTLVNSFQEHSSWVVSVAFRPDGKVIATSSDDTTVKLWKPDRNMTILHTLQGHSSRVENVVFSPDGKMIATASDDKTVKLWNFNIDDLLKHSCNWVRDYLKNNPNVTEKDRRLCDDID